MTQVLLVVHVLISFALIGLILMQNGKGSDMGSAFGAGASGTVFGSQGSGNFLTKLTSFLATAFFVNCLVLAYLASHTVERASVVEQVGQMEQQVPGSENKDIPSAMAPIEEGDLNTGENPQKPSDVPVVPE